MAKRKKIMHLHDDEVAVVFSVDVWRHIISTYELHANEADSYDDKMAWLGIAEDILIEIDKAKVDEWDD